MTLGPADGGRRSRRGFLYQDAVTLLDCLDMLDGHWTEVSWEDLEDVLCYTADAPSYRQVKTVEGAKRHSIADICKPDPAKKTENRTAATSYLGKLFGGKPLPEGTRFTLIVNETPQRDLFQFVCERGGTRGPISAEDRERIVEKLDGLSLPDGRDVGWCVDRLDVLVTARSCDQVEDEARRRLVPLITTYLGQDPLAQEVDNVLLGLHGYIARRATEPEPRRHTADEFRCILGKTILQVTGQRPDGSTEPLMTLQAKLRPAGVPNAEAERQHQAMLAFRQTQRRSLGSERQRLAELSDKVYAICQLTSMQRRGGLIEAGEPAYRATMLAVSQMREVVSGTVDLSQALAALSDITARCQNRYEDAS
ncbi:dsDNA nuclease domain-containing protein [Streptomyces sp. Ru73]|uniref:dsDNA nuclease domain-containing protein n=1 Tax=Streptomyces sp. Ru73 TaxID=2080748 RepID=UPI0015E36FF8|nr:dsDNA nuclease domain-containing protein [Streptomyces sp. Ru73]